MRKRDIVLTNVTVVQLLQQPRPGKGDLGGDPEKRKKGSLGVPPPPYRDFTILSISPVLLVGQGLYCQSCLGFGLLIAGRGEGQAKSRQELGDCSQELREVLAGEFPTLHPRPC